MSTAIAKSIELPSGYTITDRLGAGGYGEVWKATAPGGVEKAIKIVFGHCDEGMAERELKSLERIKSVRHPFVLSIERYEIVNNRLVIVTELADMSLSDAFQNCLSEGLDGIPRQQLISYLWDAAEALDCLVEQHSLQHLDVKPENLLLVGDHIKVADFGLVKELASKTLNSMMGGMTPIYSAPEIYDDNPSSRSDQYSLAIVYQHMLTGSLPFPGRTPAQLAKQHTLAEPNVNPLGDEDRVVVRKALEKDPAKRFSSCREFVAALRSTDRTTPAKASLFAGKKYTQPSHQTENDDTKSIALLETKHIEKPVSTAATQVLPKNNNVASLTNRQLAKQTEEASSLLFPQVDSEIEDIEVPAFDGSAVSDLSPTLFIGVGGVGISMLRRIRQQVNAFAPSAETVITWLAIDTERESLKVTSDTEARETLAGDEMLHVPLRRPKQYRDVSQDLLRWVSRRWLYNIPRSLQTRGFRPLGRIAIVDHAKLVLSAIQTRLHWLVTENNRLAEKQKPVRVVLLAGMSGGTGGGTIIDLAQAVRSVCKELSLEVIVHGVLGSTFHTGSTDSLAAANMYSLLTELNHTQQSGNCGDSPLPGAASYYESSERPFDEIYTVAVPSPSERDKFESTFQSIANYLLLEAKNKVGPGMEAIRSTSVVSTDKSLFRIFSCVDLGQLANSFACTHQQQLMKALVEYWLKQCPDNKDSDAKLFDSQGNSQFAHAIFDQFPDIPIDIADASDEEPSSDEANRRTAVIKRAALAYTHFLETFEMQESNNQPPLDDAEVASTSAQIIAKFCRFLPINEIKDNELGRVLSEIFIELVNDSTKNSSANDPARLVSSALSQFETGPLDCGYRRRTMLISPLAQDGSRLLEAITKECPAVAHYKTAVAEPHLICEGSGLHPLHLGARLAGNFPDIIEAASRLHARSDICWRDLRNV